MKKLLFLLLYVVSQSVYSGDESVYIYGNDGAIEGIKYNYRDNIIKFSNNDTSFKVFNKENKLLKKCFLDNYSDNIDAGISFLTNDREAIVFQSSGRFVLTKDVIDTCNSDMNKHAKVYPAINIGTIVDMNFMKKMVLMYHPMGNISGKTVYQAELSPFVKGDYRSDNSLTEVDPKKVHYFITGKFFFNGSYKDVEKKSYSGSFGLTAGMISPDAKYVDPFGLGCDINEVDSRRPGVYEIATGKRVIFSVKGKESKEDIVKKCHLLLSGAAMLQELGGYLSK